MSADAPLPLRDRLVNLAVLANFVIVSFGLLLALAAVLVAVEAPGPVVLFAIAQLPTVIWLLGTAGLAFALGVRVERVSVGVGPVLVDRQVRDATYTLRALPLGTNVSFDADDQEHPADSPYEALSAPVRFGLAAVGPLTIFGFALVASGSDAVPAALELPGQLVRGALAPFGVAVPSWHAIFATLERDGLRIVGPLSAKLAVLQLLTAPTLVQLVSPLFEAAGLDLRPRAGVLGAAVMLVTLPLFALWGVALVAALWTAAA